LKSVFILLVLAGIRTAASASTFAFDTINRGSFTSDGTVFGGGVGGDYDYATGQFHFENTDIGTVGATVYHSYLEFGRLTGLDGPVKTATLVFFDAGGYTSQHITETLSVTEYNVDVSSLHGGDPLSAYTALANGPLVASQSCSNNDLGRSLALPLNASGIRFLNSSASTGFAFGLSLSDIPPDDFDTRMIFYNLQTHAPNDGYVRLTIVTTPAPEPAPLFSAGFRDRRPRGIPLRHVA
jgi:hypothetical protein